MTKNSTARQDIPPGCKEVEIRFATWKIPKGREMVLVREISTGRFRLVCSPGWVPGLAADDIFECDQSDLGYRLISRGGNFSVQLFVPVGTAEQAKDQVQTLFSQRQDSGRVRLDGESPGETTTILVYTIPKGTKFSTIDSVFNRVKDNRKDIEWYYGNVYDTKDGITPLNWWISS